MTKSKPKIPAVVLSTLNKVGAISSIFIIVGIIYFSDTHTAVDISANPLVNKKINTDSTNQPLIFLALNNSPNLPRPENNENLMKEYSFVSFDPSTNEQQQLAVVRNNFFKEDFHYAGEKIFYVTEFGEIATYDLETKTNSVIKIPGISPSQDRYSNESTISDFFVFKNKIFYIRGGCDKINACVAGVYDVVTRNNEILVSDLHKKIDATMQSVARLRNFDATKNILSLTKHGGDAAYGFGHIYEVDLVTKQLTEVASTSGRVDCTEVTCAEENIVDDEVWNMIFPDDEIRCGEVSVYENNYYENVTLSLHNNDTIIKNAKYVGCKSQ